MGHEDMAGADTAPAVTTQPDGLGRPSPQWAVGHEDSHFSLSPRRPRVRPKLQDQVRGPVLRACCPPDPVPGPRQGGTNVGCPLCFYHGCPPPPLGSTQRQVPSGPTPGPVSCSGHLSRLPPPSRLSQRSSALFSRRRGHCLTEDRGTMLGALGQDHGQLSGAWDPDTGLPAPSWSSVYPRRLLSCSRRPGRVRRPVRGTRLHEQRPRGKRGRKLLSDVIASVTTVLTKYDLCDPKRSQPHGEDGWLKVKTGARSPWVTWLFTERGHVTTPSRHRVLITKSITRSGRHSRPPRQPGHLPHSLALNLASREWLLMGACLPTHLPVLTHVCARTCVHACVCMCVHRCVCACTCAWEGTHLAGERRVWELVSKSTELL